MTTAKQKNKLTYINSSYCLNYICARQLHTNTSTMISKSVNQYYKLNFTNLKQKEYGTFCNLPFSLMHCKGA